MGRLGLMVALASACGPSAEAVDPDTGTSDTGQPASSDSSSSGESEPPDVVEAACPEVAAESVYCVTSTFDASLVVLGLDSGRACTLWSQVPLPGEHLENGLIWDGEAIVGCSESVVRLDLETEQVEVAGVPCFHVAESDGLFVMNVESTEHYASFAAALADAPDGEFASPPFWTSAVGAGDHFFVSGPSGDALDRYRAADLMPIDAFPVAQGDGRPWGMSALGSSLLLHNRVEGGPPRVDRYDLVSATKLDTVELEPADPGYFGLACRTGS